ncbi:hypothetical protein BZA77DRAFT_320143 [Pyronema omphalodes]|nr:hypothetical protein BZA77DRAFT_320143 [Pyronema omphalodes]
MDLTFITMHDNSDEARILYASDSIDDVLGYNPSDVVGQSSFLLFQPESRDEALTHHRKLFTKDTAAELKYCNMKRRDGTFVVCECVFTVVYNVVVSCTSLYKYTEKSRQRALHAPAISEALSRNLKDPRFGMLKHLSSKFTTTNAPHEPRCALILNRFTRTLTVMYATIGLQEILGVPAEEVNGKSFYELIDEACLVDAAYALEKAKENDSIAYLRFRVRDPRNNPRLPQHPMFNEQRQDYGDGSDGERNGDDHGHDDSDANLDTTSSQGSSRDEDSEDDDDDDEGNNVAASTPRRGNPRRNRRNSTPDSIISGAEPSIEVEAVISCTSDGLVVILRKAHGIPPIKEGFALAPWAYENKMPWNDHRPYVPTPNTQEDLFMKAIREVAVFAWSLKSINEDIMCHVVPGTLKPSASEVVGNYTRKGTTFYRREREWEVAMEQRSKRSRDGEEEEGRESESRPAKKR